jgi:hypothetical protein
MIEASRIYIYALQRMDKVLEGVFFFPLSHLVKVVVNLVAAFGLILSLPSECPKWNN